MRKQGVATSQPRPRSESFLEAMAPLWQTHVRNGWAMSGMRWFPLQEWAGLPVSQQHGKRPLVHPLVRQRMRDGCSAYSNLIFGASLAVRDACREAVSRGGGDLSVADRTLP